MFPLLQIPTNTRHLQVKVGALNHNLYRTNGNSKEKKKLISTWKWAREKGVCIYRGKPSFAFHIHTANYIIHVQQLKELSRDFIQFTTSFQQAKWL